MDSILEFLDDRLLSDNLHHLTRGDYKELLEFAKVCLGGTIEIKKTYSYQLSRPGADHHARRMSQCLYILKLSLLQHQIDTISPQTKKKINTMASFILFVYIKFWFSSPSLTRAATYDIQLGADRIGIFETGPDRTGSGLPIRLTGPDRTGYRIRT